MRRKTLVNKISLALATVFLGVSSISGTAFAAAEIPYDTYNYNYREDFVLTPAAYVPTGAITGATLGIDGFLEPQDLCKAPDGKMYIADTKNNRIVVLDKDLKSVVRIIDSVDGGGSFASPMGVCVSEKNELYVADSDNKRIVVMTPEGKFIKQIDNPQSTILEDNFDFVPLKITVDYADRVYCIAKNAFEGILVFESDGTFTGYFGTIEVKISLWEKFWKRLATKEERAKQQLYIPTEFTGIDIDTDGFVYASNIDSEGIQGVRRLNPRGEDVIQKGENKNVGGDINWNTYGDFGGPSEFTDVVYRGKGMYSCLDRKRGRIFTYDKEGNLLYIFGGLGTQEGTFLTPVAIEAIGDQVIVLDAIRNSILIFGETEYGNNINTAVGLRYDGDETQAIYNWSSVLRLDENNELANAGLGKAYLTAGDNKAAMHYLKLAMNRKYYSIAYKRYRNEILQENMSIWLTVIIVLIIGFVVYRKFFQEKVKEAFIAKKEKKNQKKGG